VSQFKVQYFLQPDRYSKHFVPQRNITSKLPNLWFDKAGSEKSFCILAYGWNQNYFASKCGKKMESIWQM